MRNSDGNRLSDGRKLRWPKDIEREHNCRLLSNELLSRVEADSRRPSVSVSGFVAETVDVDPSLSKGRAMHSGEIPSLSGWLLFSPEAIDKSPVSPGVYVFRLKEGSFGRVLGHSDVVYIGGTTTRRAMGTIRGRLKQHAGSRELQWLRRISKQVGSLEVAWIPCSSPVQALMTESDLLKRYSDDHIELPPGNRQRSAVRYQQICTLIEQCPLGEPGKIERKIRSIRNG